MINLNGYRKYVIATLLAGSLFGLSSCGNSDGDPIDAIGVRKGGRPGELGGEKNFAYLMNNHAQGRSDPTPWAGYWFPYTDNGIASNKHGKKSPAGKYDAARGFKKAQQWEISHHGPKVKGVKGWWGHCNGWCVASALYPEPREAKKVNGITFEVADIKALLSEAGMLASYDFFGNRPELEISGLNASLAANDVIPDQYFLVLTNYVGMYKKQVLMDRYTGDQVWNQPIAGYQFDYPKPEDYLGAHPDSPNVYRINLTSTLWWSEDAVPAGVISEPFEFKPSPPGIGSGDAREGVYSARTLHMEIWLDGPVEFDAEGKIKSSGNVIVTRHPEIDKFVVGGAWKNGGNGHPDYMWIPYSIEAPRELNHDGTPNTDANPAVDINWLEAYLLKGQDDPNSRPTEVDDAPNPEPTPSSSPAPSSGGNDENPPSTRRPRSDRESRPERRSDTPPASDQPSAAPGSSGSSSPLRP